ncbi:uncharacterized protein [Lolium perenne]|uniref:uncharacterized protein n=1 Tax=Lolium perenne TaxID=4522 RepID=UPI0021F4FED9|nr:uncharacterized protein LOC127304005 [Lolium perenne]
MLASLLRLCQPILALVVPRRGGSRVGKTRNKERHRQSGAVLLDSDYFADDATHTEKDFWRRFRMNKDLLMKIVFGIREYDHYFMFKQDCTSLWGFSSIQKCFAALRCFAYGATPDATDGYLCMAESTCSKTVYMFCRAIIAVFCGDYLRSSRADDTTRILA